MAHPEIAARLVAMLRQRGIDVLRDETRDVRGLQIVGMDDVWATRMNPARALATADSEKATLVLSHNPDSADLPGWGGYAGCLPFCRRRFCLFATHDIRQERSIWQGTARCTSAAASVT